MVISKFLDLIESKKYILRYFNVTFSLIHFTIPNQSLSGQSKRVGSAHKKRRVNESAITLSFTRQYSVSESGKNTSSNIELRNIILVSRCCSSYLCFLF